MQCNAAAVPSVGRIFGTDSEPLQDALGLCIPGNSYYAAYLGRKKKLGAVGLWGLLYQLTRTMGLENDDFAKIHFCIGWVSLLFLIW
jgi:hypothetical protein